MIRNELCKIAKMNPSTFNVHRKNGDLPFDIEMAEAKDGTGRTWGRFTLFHAAMLIAARQLTSQGVGWGEACRILRTRPVFVGVIGMGQNFFERPGIFVARVDFASVETNKDPDLMEGERFYRGPLSDIVEAALETAEAYSFRRAGAERPVYVTGMVTVDLSHSYSLAKLLAEDEGVDTTGDEMPDPPAEAE